MDKQKPDMATWREGWQTELRLAEQQLAFWKEQVHHLRKLLALRGPAEPFSDREPYSNPTMSAKDAAIDLLTKRGPMKLDDLVSELVKKGSRRHVSEPAKEVRKGINKSLKHGSLMMDEESMVRIVQEGPPQEDS